jgi:hypothetical protein
MNNDAALWRAAAAGPLTTLRVDLVHPNACFMLMTF